LEQYVSHQTGGGATNYGILSQLW